MMKIWGMLSFEDENNGFDLVLDDDWYVLLLRESELIARFDPRDYMSVELHKEVEAILQKLKSN